MTTHLMAGVAGIVLAAVLVGCVLYAVCDECRGYPYLSRREIEYRRFIQICQ